jgi:hypothetical protein
VVHLPDRDHRENLARLVRMPDGELYMEVQARHNGTEVFTTLRLGRLWELVPRLATLT